MKKIIDRIKTTASTAPTILVAAVMTLAVGLSFGIAPSASALGNCTVSDGVNGALNSNCSKPNNTPSSVTGSTGIITTVINIMLFIVGILSVIMIIYSGIRYVTSRGDSGQVGSAKNTLMYSVVGLVIALVAYALVNWVFASVTGTTTTTS